LKNILYIKAKAKLHTKDTTNHTTGSKKLSIELAFQLLDQVIQPNAVKTQNNIAATHNPTINHMKTLPKNHQTVTSLGALSNIATSGFSEFFGSFSLG
jgi:hypothetical protein